MTQIWYFGVPSSGILKRRKAAKKTKSDKITILKAHKQQINQVKYSNLSHCLKSVKSKEELQVAEMTRKFDPHHALGY